MKKRHRAEQAVAKLRQADVASGRGLKVPEVCKRLGIREQACCRGRWQAAAIEAPTRTL